MGTLIRDVTERAAPGVYQLFTPVIDTFPKEHIFALAAKVGERESESAGEVLAAVLNSRK